MLEITTPEEEIYIPSLNKFVTVPSCVLTLEHSLMSIARWEAKWHIPYLNNKKKTRTQELDYIRCMAVGNVKNEYAFYVLSPENLKKINDYIEDPMTATTFAIVKKDTNKREVVTAETLYYLMIAYNIPMECQKWHLNRLLTLIKVCELKNGPKKKMSKQETAQWYAAQNAARRAKYNTKG